MFWKYPHSSALICVHLWFYFFVRRQREETPPHNQWLDSNIDQISLLRVFMVFPVLMWNFFHLVLIRTESDSNPLLEALRLIDPVLPAD